MTEEIINLLDCPAMEYIAVGNQYFCKLNSCDCNKICTCGYKRLEQDSKQLTQWLDEARRNTDFWCDKCTSLEQENNTICYNLHLAEQERDELKEALAKKIITPDYVKMNEQIDELKQENRELKEKFKQVFNIDNQECWNIAFLNDEKEKYRSALEEIKNDLKEVCKEECDYTKPKFCGDCDCRYGQILNKINEVLNEGK